MWTEPREWVFNGKKWYGISKEWTISTKLGEGTARVKIEFMEYERPVKCAK